MNYKWIHSLNIEGRTASFVFLGGFVNILVIPVNYTVQVGTSHIAPVHITVHWAARSIVEHIFDLGEETNCKRHLLDQSAYVLIGDWLCISNAQLWIVSNDVHQTHLRSSQIVIYLDGRIISSDILLLFFLFDFNIVIKLEDHHSIFLWVAGSIRDQTCWIDPGS